MKVRIFIVAALLCLVGPVISAKELTAEKGFVPDEATAIKIAEAVLLPIYGEKIFKERPFKAVLKDEVWTIEGTLPKSMDGGVALIKIKKTNGEILKVTHGK